MATKKVNVSLSPERVSLGPGETAEFVATIHNTSDVVEAYSVDVQGIDTAWSKLSVTSLSLFPGDKETVRIQVTPPISSSAKAGSYPVSVRVISKRDPAIGTISSFILDLGKVSDYSLGLLPRKTRGRKGPFQLAITNNGNTVSTYKLEAFDPEGVCEFRFKSDTVAVDPGATKKTPLVVNPKKKPFTGAPRLFGFSVKSTPLEGDPKEVEGELECHALLPKWAVAAITVGVVALLALVVVLIAGRGKVGPLPIPAHDFRVEGNSYACEQFTVHGACTIAVTVKWKGVDVDALTFVLLGADGMERVRTDGAQAELLTATGQRMLKVTYTVLQDEANKSKPWKFYVANLAETATADVTLGIETES